MNIEYVSIDKGEEAVHVTALVTEDKVTREIRGSFNSLPAEQLPGWFREQFYAPEVVEPEAELGGKVGEKVEGAVPVEMAIEYVPDPERVAKCEALHAVYEAMGKVVEIAIGRPQTLAHEPARPAWQPRQAGPPPASWRTEGCAGCSTASWWPAASEEGGRT